MVRNNARGGFENEGRTVQCNEDERRNRRDGSFLALTTAAQVIGGNEDLISEILYRLSIKSLFKFKSVCKSWQSLISHPLFSHGYSIRHLPPDSFVSGGFFFKCFRPNTHHEFAPINDAGAVVSNSSLFLSGECLDILHSCNGLLLCQTRLKRYPRYYVCNPLTKELVEIGKQETSVVCSGLAFNPSKSPHYKVVVIEGSEFELKAKIVIYSSETRKWRYSNLNLRLPGKANSNLNLLASGDIRTSTSTYHRVALWNGFLHWAGKGNSTLSFHVERECFWETSKPNYFYYLEKNCINFVVSCGRLKLIETVDFMGYRILHLGSDYKQWFIYNMIDLRQMLQPPAFMTGLTSFPTGFYLLNLFSSTGESEEEDKMLIQVPGKIISYHVRDGIFEDVFQGPFYSMPTVYDSHAYSYTLSSVRPSSF